MADLTVTTTLDAVLLQTPSVSTILPADTSTGIALTQNIVVTFTTAVDPLSITTGRFILQETAQKVAPTGPGLFAELLTGRLVSTNLLDTQTYRGYIEADVTLSDDGLTATLNPTEPLQANQVYTVIISDEIESDTLSVPAADGGNTGTGSLGVTGPYDGSWGPEVFTVDVTTLGVLNVAQFRWMRSSEGVWHGPHTIDRSFENIDKTGNFAGLTLTFGAGTYQVGDSWTFNATTGLPIGTIAQFTFTTGSPTYVTPATATESNEVIAEDVGGITRISSSPTPVGAGLRVLSISPVLRATDLDLTTRLITITFNKNIDPATINDDSVQVFLESLPTDHNLRSSEPVGKTMTVNGSVLTIRVSG